MSSLQSALNWYLAQGLKPSTFARIAFELKRLWDAPTVAETNWTRAGAE